MRLYQKGIKRLEEKERHCRQIKELEERKLEEELIFKPQLVAKPIDKTQATISTVPGGGD